MRVAAAAARQPPLLLVCAAAAPGADGAARGESRGPDALDALIAGAVWAGRPALGARTCLAAEVSRVLTACTCALLRSPALQLAGRLLKYSYHIARVSSWVEQRMRLAVTKNIVFPGERV